ncbi:MAG: SAM-dependent chlorinase/fluorinase [Bacteroidales bacterium]|nr:SAM-dependent chlorinase/fluorinase [Bacteroidales bacterium]
MQSPIVTLTTDWSDRDFFAGKVKGKLYSYIPGVRVVDITHNIEPFQFMKAIFVVKNACLDFPKGTIHIIDINSSETAQMPFVVVEYKEQYYICIDNGVPGALFGRDATQTVLIDVPRETDFFTFAAADLFCKVAAMLAQGTPLSDIGEPHELDIKTPILTDLSGDVIKVPVIHVDSYGNAYLSMTYEEFERLRRGRPFTLMAREFTLNKVCHSYSDVRSGDLLLTVSSTRNLQVAVRDGSAQMLVGLDYLRTVVLTFKNNV